MEPLIAEIICCIGGMVFGGTIIWGLFQAGILEVEE
jgi:hypothetical protein